MSESLDNLPSHWSLTPLREKRPYRPNWQTETKLERQLIRSLVKDGEQAVSKKTGKPYTAYISGVGLLTGEHSDGLVALDLDGASAEPLLQAISKGELPQTVSWTSGKPGRKQLLFQVPDSYREPLKNFTRSVITEYEGIKTSTDEQGKPTELLEFRYNKMSVGFTAFPTS